jgi:hypothetical protein
VTTPEPAKTPRFEVFNRDRTIGVSAAHGGATNGIFLHDNVRRMSERTLTQEILAVARVASMRGRLSLRERMEETAAANGTKVPPETYEVLRDTPTAEEYEQARRQILKY